MKTLKTLILTLAGLVSFLGANAQKTQPYYYGAAMHQSFQDACLGEKAVFPKALVYEDFQARAWTFSSSVSKERALGVLRNLLIYHKDLLIKEGDNVIFYSGGALRISWIEENKVFMLICQEVGDCAGGDCTIDSDVSFRVFEGVFY
jgi:hypothetical protein